MVPALDESLEPRVMPRRLYGPYRRVDTVDGDTLVGKINLYIKNKGFRNKNIEFRNIQLSELGNLEIEIE